MVPGRARSRCRAALARLGSRIRRDGRRRRYLMGVTALWTAGITANVLVIVSNIASYFVDEEHTRGRAATQAQHRDGVDRALDVRDRSLERGARAPGCSARGSNGDPAAGAIGGHGRSMREGHVIARRDTPDTRSPGECLNDIAVPPRRGVISSADRQQSGSRCWESTSPRRDERRSLDRSAWVDTRSCAPRTGAPATEDRIAFARRSRARRARPAAVCLTGYPEIALVSNVKEGGVRGAPRQATWHSAEQYLGGPLGFAVWGKRCLERR